MMQRNNTVDDTPIVGSDRVRATFAGILRAAQAAGWTDESLAAASGVKKDTIKGYRVDGKEPSLGRALSIAVVLGTGAVNAMMAMVGYTSTPLDEADAREPARTAADLSHHAARFHRCAFDNRIDHTEDPEATDAADNIIDLVLPYSTRGRAA